MNIKDLIIKSKFCDSREREFELDENTKLRYYCCKKTARMKCTNDCSECKKIYARYVIIDLRNKETVDICDQFLFESDDSFQRFQENYLSDIFFYERMEVRFNIYLIFVCEGKEQVKKYGKYASDVNYARKFFLIEEEYVEYFCYYDIMVSEANNIKDILDKEILSGIEEIVNSLSTKGMKSILIKNNPKALLDYLISGKLNQLNYDAACGFKGNNKNFIEKYIYKHVDSTKINTVDFVKK